MNKRIWNKWIEEIHCHKCNTWKDARMGTYLIGEQVKCIECDELLGYDHDWKEVFGEG